jgi:predicted methyltransferase
MQRPASPNDIDTRTSAVRASRGRAFPRVVRRAPRTLRRPRARLSPIPLFGLLGLLVILASLVFPSRPAQATLFDEEVGILVDWLKLGAGSVVADNAEVDAAYAIVLSRDVAPGGKVVATRREQKDRDALALAASEAHAPNVEGRAAPGDVTGLPAGSCDAVLVREAGDGPAAPLPLAESLFETLRPGGRLVIVDSPPSGWGLFRKRNGIEAEALIAELQAAGFVLEDRLDEWPSAPFAKKRYGVAFSRP